MNNPFNGLEDLPVKRFAYSNEDKANEYTQGAELVEWNEFYRYFDNGTLIKIRRPHSPLNQLLKNLGK